MLSAWNKLEVPLTEYSCIVFYDNKHIHHMHEKIIDCELLTDSYWKVHQEQQGKEKEFLVSSESSAMDAKAAELQFLYES